MGIRRQKDADLSPEVRQIQRAAQSDIVFGNQSRLNYWPIKQDEAKRQKKNAKARLATQQKKHAKNFYVLDTETAGLKTKELIEVAAILFLDGKEDKRMKEVFMPKKKITSEA